MKTITATANYFTQQWVRATGEWISDPLTPQLSLGVSTLLKLTVLGLEENDLPLTYSAYLVESLDNAAPNVVDVSTGVNVDGDWDDADEEEGKFAIRFGLSTSELVEVLGDYEKTRIWFVLVGRDDSAIVHFSLSIPIWVWNTATAGSVTPLPSALTVQTLSVDVPIGDDYVVISDLDGRAITVTLEAPEEATVNVGVSNVAVNATRTTATVYLTTAVALEGYKLRCVLYEVDE